MRRQGDRKVKRGIMRQPGKSRLFCVCGKHVQELGIALCLVLVLEGILPFLYPRHWRGAVMQAARLPDRRLRLMGLASMLLGTALLYLLH